MRLIDTNTGELVTIGKPFWNIDGRVTVLKVEEGWFTAKALVQVSEGLAEWVELVVRWTHPNFFLQKVAFLPS